MLALHGLLVIVVAATGLLGWWQLDAWRAVQANDVADRLDRGPVALAAVLGRDDPLTGQDVGVPVVVEGRYAPAGEQFLVSGRELDGVEGFWVLSPLRVAGAGSSLLVVRGWAAAGDELPPVPSGSVRETGVLLPGEEGSGAVSAGRVVTSVRVPALVGEVRGDLYGAYLLRTDTSAADPASLEPVPPPAGDPPWDVGLRNLAYGAQWWLFGGFAVFMWWRICADRLAASRGSQVSQASQ